MPIAPYYPPSEPRGREQQQHLPDAVTLRAPSPFHLDTWPPAPLPVPRCPIARFTAAHASLPMPRCPCLAARAPCDCRPPSVTSDAALPRPQGIFKAGLWPHPLPYSLYDPAGISKKRTGSEAWAAKHGQR